MKAQPQAPRIVKKSREPHKETKNRKKGVFKMMDKCMYDCDEEDDEIESKPRSDTHEVIFSILSYFIFKINQFP